MTRSPATQDAPDQLPPDSRLYSPPELLSDRIVHLAALALAAVGVPVLITQTALWRGDLPGVLSVSLYGVTLIAMLTASLLYNHLPRPDWRDTLMRLDRSAIYLKIAGTYTPFALLSGTGGGLLAGMWATAVLGTIGNFRFRHRPVFLGLGICLGMGWAVVVGGQGLLAQLSPAVYWLMLIGGVLYTLGTIFLVYERMRYHNTIWHVFVVTASAVFFAAIFLHAAETAAI
jgi:hemolysin III